MINKNSFDITAVIFLSRRLWLINTLLHSSYSNFRMTLK